MVWHAHLFLHFPQFIVIHTVKGFGIVNKAEIDVFLELSCFFNDPADVGNLISGSSVFSKTSLNIWKFMVRVLLKPGFDHGCADITRSCLLRILYWRCLFPILFLLPCWLLPFLSLPRHFCPEARLSLF